MKTILRSFPWIGMAVMAAIAIPKFASSAPPPERHPHIRAAVHELEEARRELKAAAHDFCGHRAEALEESDRAIKQLQSALACDRH